MMHQVLSSWKMMHCYRDMHAFECGKDYVGLCDNMTTINGETLLKFLRNVSFTGERFILFLPPHLLKCPHKSWKLMKKSEQVLVDQNWFFLLERWGKHFPIEPDFFGLKRLFWPWLNSIVIAHSIFSSGLTGDEFKFNQHGDGPARYNIIHYKQVSKGQFEWVTVGYFYDDRMQLDMDGKSDNNRPLDYYFRDAAIFFLCNMTKYVNMKTLTFWSSKDFLHFDLVFGNLNGWKTPKKSL